MQASLHPDQMPHQALRLTVGQAGLLKHRQAASAWHLWTLMTSHVLLTLGVDKFT